MNHLPFIIAAYAVAIGGVLALLGGSWLAMRRMERRAEELGTRR